MTIATPAILPPDFHAPRALKTVSRPSVRGKFLFAGEDKFPVRGVTYGPFRPQVDGSEYHTCEQVRQDFAQMAARGMNTVRVYTVPPRWLLDIAADNGLRVMVGLPWEQHVTFLDGGRRAADIIRRVREGVRTCAGHPAILAYSVGNEIPASIVRWYGSAKLEKFIRRLYDAVKAEDPTAMVTYVNYPSTEYLHLPFLDFICFNVYLEAKERLEAYLARLQNIAGDRPLLMAEIGLDSLRNGDDQQGKTLEWQIQSVFEAGCAGVFVFAWTDEWHRGGNDILDWKFGLTTIERKEKSALALVERAFADTPFEMDRSWPRISVMICTRNGAATIRETLTALRKLEYPEYEVIVVDDGSTDETVRIAREFGVQVIGSDRRNRDAAAGAPAENMGLSVARNVGLAVATGEIIAYLDDDAYPDEHWLMYLAHAFAHTSHVGIGGPNIAPEGDGVVAEAVSRSPGNAMHVLLDDRLAEHLPGCNMAFRTEALRTIGGFDPQFKIAGDDVDLCWRIQEKGWTLGFTAGAMVWHHRRKSARRFWRQQYHYGAAEAQLQKKWPAKYSADGRITWAGRMYDQGLAWIFGSSRRRIYHGTWGSSLFQSVYEASASVWASAGLMPEWYLLIGMLAIVSIGGIFWRPLCWVLPLLAVVVGITLAQAIAAGRRATFVEARASRARMLRVRSLTAFFHVMQPLARLMGRVGLRGLSALPFKSGLNLFRTKGRHAGFAFPWARTISVWYEKWESPETRLAILEKQLRDQNMNVTRGGEYDRWDLEISVGRLCGARVWMTIEEHGNGKQMVRWRVWPRVSVVSVLSVAVFGLGVMLALCNGLWLTSAMAGIACAVMVMRTIWEGGTASAAVKSAQPRDGQ
jgi:GT2 family glycosyltransferase